MILGILAFLIILSLLVIFIKKKNTVAIVICLIVTVVLVIFASIYIKDIDTFKRHYDYNMNQTDINMILK